MIASRIGCASVRRRAILAAHIPSKYAVRHFSATYPGTRDTLSQDVSARIRELMRRSAQPVAIITALVEESSIAPSHSEHHDQFSLTPSGSAWAHGATLSSFTTVSMDPPLVAFSLRTPSRLADAISSGKRKGTNDNNCAHFIVNVLTTKQETAAHGFSRPGLAPFALGEHWDNHSRTPQTRPTKRDGHPFQAVNIHPSLHATGPRSESVARYPVPVLSESMGSLACSLVARIRLHDDLGSTLQAPTSLESLIESTRSSQQQQQQQHESITGSDLFIARVHGVEEIVEDPEAMPLLYRDRRFTTSQQ